MDQYNVHGPIVDQPVAALSMDLKYRGMLDDTPVVFIDMDALHRLTKMDVEQGDPIRIE